jgi:hypothetical protein
MLSCFTIAMLCQASLSYNDLYDWKVSQNRAELPNRLLHSAGYALVMLAILVFLLPRIFLFPGLTNVSSETWKLILLLAIAFAAIYGWRQGFHWFFYKWNFGERVLVLGTGERGALDREPDPRSPDVGLRGHRAGRARRRSAERSIAAHDPRPRRGPRAHRQRQPRRARRRRAGGAPRHDRDRGAAAVPHRRHRGRGARGDVRAHRRQDRGREPAALVPDLRRRFREAPAVAGGQAHGRSARLVDRSPARLPAVPASPRSW